MSGVKIKVVAVSVLIIACALLSFVLKPAPAVSVESQLRSLRRHFLRGDHVEVVKLGEQLLSARVLTDAAAIMAGESATKHGRLEQATVFYRIIQATSQDYTTAQFALAEVQRELGQISEAEVAYNNVLDRKPNDYTARSRIAYLKMITGRVSAAVVDLRKLLALQKLSWMELCWLAVPDRGVDAVEYLEKCRLADSTDAAPIIGLASTNIDRGRFAEAARQLGEISELSTLADQRQTLEFRVKLQTGEHVAVPPDAADRFERYVASHNYEALFVLGAVYESNGQTRNAIVCFARCLENEDHLGAMQHLQACLTEAQPGTDLTRLQRRLSLMSELNRIIRSIHGAALKVTVASEVSVVMAQLGREEEYLAWASVSQQPPITSTVDVKSADISDITRQCLKQTSIVSVIGKEHVQETQPSHSVGGSAADIILMDSATAIGLKFTYFESPDTATEGRRMIEFTGGGVGILDLDNDTWPDVHLTQGTVWPVDRNSQQWLDALYRNARGQQFVDVTTVCGLTENGFSQGISCGDLNNDGFTDVVVANIGHNSYWLNQGDGTFVEFLPVIDIVESGWTSSCAIADINLDGLPDVIEVNYLTGEGVESVICETPAGPRVCAPHVFPATIDRLLLNTGAGRFVDATRRAGIDLAGNGLGIVVANLDQDPMPEIFVANDGTPNFLWDNTAAAGESPLFRDAAVSRGVAYGSEGLAQACMGVAVDDFNRDGTTDLFVTNYFNEANALYLFNEEGLAMDASMPTGVRSTSMAWLGFGTQAVDINADDWPDIFLVNGDLDDFSHEGRAFRMPPQLLISRRGVRFAEQSNIDQADLRSSRFRGRGVARCDWNQDQQWDLVVSCLDDPAMLVTNPSLRTGMTMVTFVGTTSSRDAVGTSVLQSGLSIFQLDAGSGYMASNEKAALLPISGDLKTRWPGSLEETPLHISDHHRHVIIEGRAHCYHLPQ